MAEVKKTVSEKDAATVKKTTSVAKKKEPTTNETSSGKKAKAAPKKAAKKAGTSVTNKTTEKKTVKKASAAADQKPVAPKAAEPAVKAAAKEPAVQSNTQPKGSDAAVKTVSAAAEPAQEASVKKATPKKPAAKKSAPKKTSTKKSAVSKKEEIKKEEPAKAEEKKVEVKKEEPAKAEEKKVEAKKEEPVKAEEKKVEAKKEEPAKAEEKKAEVKKEEPVVVEKQATETISPEEKAKVYADFSLDTLIDMARALGIDKGYDDYKNILLDESDLDKITASLKEEAKLADTFLYEDDGFDIDMIPVLLSKVGDTMELKASDFDDLSNRVNKAMQLELSEDALANTEVYNELFDTVRQVLILAQRRNIRSLEEIDRYLRADVKALVIKFMDVAYEVLKNWQYKDVKYYEGFIYSVLSQFDALHDELGNRAMMDVADLLIVHGDYGLGDANYRYIIRENALKDMIYFRFANIYRDIDRDKARAIANEALQWVDGRYDYYPAIIDILEN